MFKYRIPIDYIAGRDVEKKASGGGINLIIFFLLPSEKSIILFI
jgi:hypothetical protein